MPNSQSILAGLQAKGSQKARATYARHGIPLERSYGVSVADLKVIAKKIKGRQALALELYETGIMDAMYLAGMVASGALMSRSQLQFWADGSGGMTMIAEYTVPWVTVENPEARTLATQWIDSPRPHVATSGWCSYAGLLATQPDSTLDLAEIESLLDSVVRRIHTAPNRVRLTMNGFVIAVAAYVKPLHTAAQAAAHKIGVVTADMGDTDCQIRLATEAIAKGRSRWQSGPEKENHPLLIPSRPACSSSISPISIATFPSAPSIGLRKMARKSAKMRPFTASEITSHPPLNE
ncbi:MAG TPA: DNA alkylation repair protein [Terracidiphilus sp.]|jgi:3-methyladenine DNA glycosylase AlkD